MSRSERIALVVLVPLLLLGLGGGALLLVGSRGPSAEGDPALESATAATGEEHAAPVDDGRVPIESPQTPRAAPPSSALPLVEVILQKKFDPYAAARERGLPERGAGKTASLDGVVTDGAGSPVRGARLRFLSGLSEGEETTSDAEGRYTFPRLYPGLQLLEIETPAGEAIVREVRLLRDKPERATFHFAPAIEVSGRVVDRQGQAVADAEVRIDRRTAFTDAEGRFAFGGITPGGAIVYVVARGFTPLRAPLDLPPGSFVDPERVRLVLHAGGTLVGEIRGAPGEGGPPHVAIVPDTPPLDRSFPFELFGRIEVAGNGPFEVPAVPMRKLLRIRVFHPLGVARPAMRMVFLREEGERNVAPVIFQFDAVAPARGRVFDGEAGRPFAGATVSLEVADLFRESVASLPGAGEQLAAYCVVAPPDLRSTATTGPDGGFVLGTGEGGGLRWLEASAPGYRPLARAFRGGRGEVEGLVLFREETFERGATLVVRIGGDAERRVALTLNGSAKEEVGLAAGAPFEVAGLEPAIYDLRVRVGGRQLLAVGDLAVGRRTEVSVSP